MALFSSHNVRMKGVSACVPKEKELTKDYALFSNEEHDLFVKSVGIAERRVAPFEVTTSDLCFHAAEKSIKDLDWKKRKLIV